MQEPLTMFVVYENPTDAPPGLPFMVRAQRVVEGRIEVSPNAAHAPTLELARACVPQGRVMLPRDPGDDPCIREIWL